MKAIPWGLNTKLMHDFGTDRVGQDNLYSAVILYRFDIVRKHGLWPILHTLIGLDEKTDFAKV